MCEAFTIAQKCVHHFMPLEKSGSKLKQIKNRKENISLLIEYLISR